MSFVVSRPTNLADPRLGAKVVFATDDFFADKARMISPADPVFIPGKYDENGKWMDGWESRRKRVPGHDWAIVKLARPGTVEAIEIDTRHFTGNYPPAASLEGCSAHGEIPGDDALWSPLTPVVALNGNDCRYLEIVASGVFTHVRLNIFPDGGVARLRIYGRVRAPLEPYAGHETSEHGALYDLAAATNGGRGLLANDEHFGKVANLLLPGRGADMGDGWETRRRRDPGHDWAIVELAAPAVIEAALVDTAHFKGNYPDRCFLQASAEAPADPASIAKQSESWPVIMPEQKLQMDAVHLFKEQLSRHAPVRCVRLNIIPDGGVSRLRLLGRPAG
jgi:allantoicase